MAPHQHTSLEERLENWLPPHHRATKTLWHGRFENPWDTFEVRSLHLLPERQVPSRHALKLPGCRQRTPPRDWCSCLLQDRSWSDVRRWNRERKQAGVPADGWLLGNRDPMPADFQAAFPLVPVDYAVLQAGPGAAGQPAVRREVELK